MSNSVLVIGASGTGKSTSIRNLDPKSTFIINVLNKPLPFKNYKKLYTEYTRDNPKGNYFASDNYMHVMKCIDKVNKERHDIKTLIVDDIQYILINAFMRRSKERGFDKYSELANDYWQIMTLLTNCRDDLVTVVLSHNELDSMGKSKIKTVGKLLDEKIAIEGMFTTVLQSLVVDGEYKFQTQGDEYTIAKSPMEMFSDKYIDNDLVEVINKIKEYNGVDEIGETESGEPSEIETIKIVDESL